ncbi:MAG: hypothetical protein ACOC85_00305 [Thermoplasmatota archaeon]
MAKRKKKEEKDEDLDFEFPEFDRLKYMKEEIKKGKSVMACVAIAPLFSFLSFQIFVISEQWLFGFLVGIVGIFILGYYLDFIRIDTSHFGKKEWATNGAMFFFTWLAVWIILMNPPVSDFADPQVDDVEIEVYEGNEWVPIEDANVRVGDSYNIRIVAEVTDNVEVREDSVNIEFQGENYQMEKIDDHLYSVELDEVTARDNPYNIIISMEDINNNSNRVGENIYFQPTE